MDHPAVRQGVQLLRQRRWYAAHDAFELAWREAAGDARRWLQGLIHAAVSFEHLRRGNARGAHSQWQKAELKLDPAAPAAVEFDLARWRDEVQAFHARIELPHRVEEQAQGTPSEPMPDPRTWPVPHHAEPK